MVLVMLPADRRAQAGVAGGGRQPRRHVVHLLAARRPPGARARPLLGGFLLLFANAFSAYATAYALTTQAANLVPVQIRFFLQGNMITGKANVGYALAAWMIIIMLVTMGVYLLLRRRAERWQR